MSDLKEDYQRENALIFYQLTRLMVPLIYGGSYVYERLIMHYSYWHWFP